MASYTAVVLMDEDRRFLCDLMSPLYYGFLQNAGYLTETKHKVPLAHHMTMNMGKCKDPELLGKHFLLTIDAWAIDQKVVAVRVCDTGGLECGNETPHITVFVHPEHGKPKDANKLINWVLLPTPLPLMGTVMEQ